jgi:hypothetical protein
VISPNLTAAQAQERTMPRAKSPRQASPSARQAGQEINNEDQVRVHMALAAGAHAPDTPWSCAHAWRGAAAHLQVFLPVLSWCPVRRQRRQDTNLSLCPPAQGHMANGPCAAYSKDVADAGTGAGDRANRGGGGGCTTTEEAAEHTSGASDRCPPYDSDGDRWIALACAAASFGLYMATLYPRVCVSLSLYWRTDS